MAKPDAKPNFNLSTTASAVVADGQGRGSLQVHFDKVKTESGVTLTLKGADVASVTFDPQDMPKPDAKNVVVLKDGLVTLNLLNLTPSAKVTVGATDEDAKTSAADITLPVVRAAPVDNKSTAGAPQDGK